ncbi:MAG: xanthine dehydrogenase accessory protein XdhC [Rhodospirillaceae bacterium]|nr:xanthine dehydrogenase accessory protein XdhC [Rhodospirillaceae bacterium]MYF85418.1 xanthine dehydrogenase accessory protein XdhC [Rhodospirillaceae bacterium]MYH37797.1 xanthine dehydrogenase accessory protein XdhC [Rhodospirillaceae bacterium]MYK12720.1 xanthine dehydrogenase accessory protein XdhC [Rhodospirillaceae bacterium]MYK58607.1 xanthine dehydrogenase accessory protein XdhC [Rhodospirillaceae bacterium]
MTAAWLDTVRERIGAGGGLVSVIVATAEGSAPREPGAWMLVDADGQSGTIGGGRLEWEATRRAREILAAPRSLWLRDLRDYPLGPDLEQCCGGFVRLLYERIGAAEIALIPAPAPAGSIVLHPVSSGSPVEIVADRRAAKSLPFPAAKPAAEILSGQAPRATVLTPPEKDRWLLHPVEPSGKPLFLYGAGHVGRAIVRALDGLPFAVTWVDTDEARFPRDVPAGVRRLVSREPAEIAAAAPDGAFHLVLTYSHAMDHDICHALLAANRFGFAGLIGSETKRARFFKRFRDAGIAEPALARLTCPIGISGIPGKDPATIAVTVAAQLLHRLVSADAVSGADERRA